ncbi:MAG TPA: metal-dependent hydrolase [Candidatus Binatia bacterium]
MCTVMTHPVVPIAASVLLPVETASRNLLIAGAICSVVPDLDVIGFSFGVRYNAVLGHRGLTHSIFFAAVVAVVVTFTAFNTNSENRLLVLLFLFLSTLSHPILDALTNGGSGVGFFAPFSNKRYFFPYHPIEVSPIGIAFFSRRGLDVLLSELRWVWLPSSIFFVVVQFLKRMRPVL